MKPDYRSYTLEELNDVNTNIDREAFPERYLELLKELSARKRSESEQGIVNEPKKTMVNSRHPHNLDA